MHPNKFNLSFLFLPSFVFAILLFVTVSPSFAESGEITWTGKHRDGPYGSNIGQYPIDTNMYKIPYSTTDDVTINYFYGYYHISDVPLFGLKAEIIGTGNDDDSSVFEYKIPRIYPLLSNPIHHPTQDDHNLDIQVDGAYIGTASVILTDCFYEISIPIHKGKQDISQRFSMILAINNQTLAFQEQSIPDYCTEDTIIQKQQTLPSSYRNPFIDYPFKQLELGKDPKDVLCMFPLNLYIKEDTKPLCLQNSTYEKLVTRGYF